MPEFCWVIVSMLRIAAIDLVDAACLISRRGCDVGNELVDDIDTADHVAQRFARTADDIHALIHLIGAFRNKLLDLLGCLGASLRQLPDLFGPQRQSPCRHLRREPLQRRR